jgi:hypothetical protein
MLTLAQVFTSSEHVVAPTHGLTPVARSLEHGSCTFGPRIDGPAGGNRSVAAESVVQPVISGTGCSLQTESCSLGDARR